MGIAPDIFNTMTPAEFIYAWIGWMEKQENEIRQAWERERWAVWILTSIQLDKKDRQSASQMFPLPWEVVPAGIDEELTMEERRRRVDEIINSTK